MRTQKTKYEWIEGEAFYLARRRAGLTPGQAADMLQVTTRTIRNWEKDASRIPYAAFRLMRLFSGHAIVSKAWDGWSIREGVLYNPVGRGFEPYQLNYLGNYLWMARQWLKERAAANASNVKKPTFLATRVAKTSIPELETFTLDEASSATALSGSRLHQSDGSVNSNIAGLQEKNISSQLSQKLYEIRTIAEAANDVLDCEVR